MQLDLDNDNFGNACDCDFNQDVRCDINDFSIFVVDFQVGTDSGVGTDMNGDGAVGIEDYSLFLAGFTLGVPGPSAFAP